MDDETKAVLSYAMALQDVIECLVVELAKAKTIDIDALCERIEFISAARQSKPETAYVARHMHAISEILRAAVDAPNRQPRS